eukprot:Rhum_TRINITY_DN21641_c0_g1::Rhum_TRINITY_DN21641_c0_g1_i1::g.174423::m.174423
MAGIVELQEKLRMEETGYHGGQLPAMRELVLSARTDAESRLSEVEALRARLAEARKSVGELRRQIAEKRAKKEGAPPPVALPAPEADASQTYTQEELAERAQAALEALKKQAQSDELKKTVKQAAATFIQSMCKQSMGGAFSRKSAAAAATSADDDAAASSASPDSPSPRSEPAEKKKTGLKSKLSKAWGSSPKDKDVEKEKPAQIITLALDAPKGTIDRCAAPVSGFSIALSCKDPANKTVEQLAAEGGTISLAFDLAQDAAQTDELIAAATEYFETYFSERIAQEGGHPEVDIRVENGVLTATGKLSVHEQKVGGVLGKMQDLASGQLDSKELLGPYTDAQATEAMRALHHLRFNANFVSEAPFDEIIGESGVNWGYFDLSTGAAEIVVERSVYKSIQRVVDSFSSIAAAKMGVGGRFFKKLNFKVDGMLFVALREDKYIDEFISSKLGLLTGQQLSLDSTDREKFEAAVENLETLHKSIKCVKSITFSLPTVNLRLSFQGFDFFQLALTAAKTAAETYLTPEPNAAVPAVAAPDSAVPETA